MKSPRLAVFAGLALLALAAPAAFSQTLTFTVETTTNGGTSVTPRLTWLTTPAAGSCAASNGWTGTKAASGTELAPAITITKDYTLTCQWPGTNTAVVTWVAPTVNNDGTAYTNPGGFRLMYGKTNTEAGLDTSAYVQDPAARSWTSPTLAAGVWYFGVKAYNAQGLEGPLSNIASKTMVAAASQTRTLTVAIKFPGAASNVAVQ